MAVAILGCGNSSTATNDSAPKDKPPVTAQGGSLDKVLTDVVQAGKGTAAKTGDMLTLLYRGVLKDGTVFDGNMDANGKALPGKDPLPMTLGAGMVIPGWDIGLKDVKTGEVRKLSIPASFAYGEKGQGKVPPNADLFFTVKCLYVVSADERMTIDIETEKEGKGQPCKKGDRVKIHYVGKLLSGRQFDSSRDRKTAYEFTLGAGDVVPGFDKGVSGMKKGEIRKVIIPPQAAYGADPSNGIPPNSVLEFEIELLTINGK
ncbi:MAG TPA: FKBP-type peptidyl-prolyl cis-trans isomerase [Fimbriimonadaceae bacterium]|nr:FKBP-type peptidyl-prolyl cis-trans isomerase [Fimbriimonadaceae bacterium]